VGGGGFSAAPGKANKGGMTALMAALNNGDEAVVARTQVVRHLLDAAARLNGVAQLLNAADAHGSTALVRGLGQSADYSCFVVFVVHVSSTQPVSPRGLETWL